MSETNAALKLADPVRAIEQRRNLPFEEIAELRQDLDAALYSGETTEETAHTWAAFRGVKKFGDSFDIASEALTEMVRKAVNGYLDQNIDADPERTSLSESPPAPEPDVSNETTRPEFVPLGSKRPAPFPVDALPDALRTMALEIAEVTGTPPCMSAPILLSVCSYAVSHKAEVRLTEDRSTQLNLFLAVLAPSGAGKSPVFGHAMAPLEAFQSEERAQLEEKIANDQFTYDQNQRRLNSIQKRLSNLSQVNDAEEWNDLSTEGRSLQRELNRGPRPTTPSHVVTNFTIPALAEAMSRNGERIAALTDEGDEVFKIAGGKHNSDGGADVNFMNSAYSGAPEHSVRIGRDVSPLQKPALTIGIMLQPEAMRRHATGRREFVDQGFIPRFLMSEPHCPPGRTPIKPRAIERTIRDAYHNSVTRLLARPVDRDETTNEIRPVYLTLDTDADAHWAAFQEELNARSTEDGDLAGMLPFVSKLRENFTRLAGVLHAVAYPESWHAVEIDAETVVNAIEIARYYLEQQKHLGEFLHSDDATLNALRLAKALVRWKQAGRSIDDRLIIDESNRFRCNDAFRAIRGSRSTISKKDDMNRPIGQLLEHGYVWQVSERPEIYEMDPMVFEHHS